MWPLKLRKLIIYYSLGICLPRLLPLLKSFNSRTFYLVRLILKYKTASVSHGGKWAVVTGESFWCFVHQTSLLTHLSPQGRTSLNLVVKSQILNEFIPICRVGSFHRSLSGVLSDMSLYLIRSRSWAPEVIIEIANSKKLLETHTFARNIWRTPSGFWYPCYTVWRSGMTVTAFVYTTNSTVLMNEHVRLGLFGVSLTHPAHSNSSLIRKLLNCLVIDTT